MICEFTGVVEQVATYDKGFTTVRDHADPDRHVEAIFPNWCDLREGVAVKGRLVSWVPWAQARGPGRRDGVAEK